MSNPHLAAMDDTETPGPNWRIPKACQECRRRKIKCNGDNPCKTCSLRRTPCLYRDITRQRKKRQPTSQSRNSIAGDGSISNGSSRAESMQSHQDRQEPPINFNNSVSATHMTSPSNKVQLYYGSTSHFALIHEIYRDLTAKPGHLEEAPHGRVEEAGAGLDMLSFRTIFFGIPADQQKDSIRAGSGADPHIMFLSHDLARRFLDSFLASLYGLLPVWPSELFYRRLGQLYSSRPSPSMDRYQRVLMMALALGAVVTEHHAWGDVLYERVKASCNFFDETINLQTVQLFMFMAHFENEIGRPNSCYLHLGNAARKAISAGLHKEPPANSEEPSDVIEERRRTFWYLYFYEIWISFHLGRPSSLSRRDAGVPLPQDPFCSALIFLAEAMCRSADELYGRPHESLLQMWRIAKSIWEDLRSFDVEKMQPALGFGLDKRPQPGAVGVQQAMCITLYYHTILLSFRPFLIFRGRWNQGTTPTTTQGEVKTATHSTTKREIPPWLNEACGIALSGACRTIHFLCESFSANPLVRGIRYHSYFLTSSCMALTFDLIHGQDLASSHLPWVYATLRALSTMGKSDTVGACIRAITTILKQLDPAYESPPSDTVPSTYALDPSTIPIGQYPMPPSQTQTMPSSNIHTAGPGGHPVVGSANNPNPFLYDFQGNSLDQGMHMPVGAGSTGNGEDLLDFTLSDTGWDFDFSTMDLETFFSVSPAFDAGGL
ncbi:fungal-specific transcription factor domain-containing protein [Aspergillus unguis]